MDIKELAPFLKEDLEIRHTQGGTKIPGMKKVSMVIVSLVINLATKPWTVSTMQKEMLNGTKLPGMKRVSMVIVFLVINLNTKP